MSVETFDPNAIDQQLSEGLTGEIDFSSFADEPSQGAWPNGWYKATIIDGYATRRGHQFQSEDVVSKAGDSRNLRFCFAVTRGAGVEDADKRNLQEQFNYRPEILLTADGLAHLKEARAEFKNAKSWPGAAKVLQSSSITLGRLGQLQKAIGLKLQSSTGKSFNPSVFFGQALDVRVGVDEAGFNTVNEFAKAGEKAKK